MTAERRTIGTFAEAQSQSAAHRIATFPLRKNKRPPNNNRCRSPVCPCCGQPIVPEGLGLPPIKARILEAVQRHPGISAEELREIVWAADANGGPEDRKVLHVHVHQLNQRLAPFGVVVRAPKGAGAGYRVRLLDARNRGPPTTQENTRRGSRPRRA